MGSSSTLIYTTELILCFTIFYKSANLNSLASHASNLKCFLIKPEGIMNCQIFLDFVHYIRDIVFNDACSIAKTGTHDNRLTPAFSQIKDLNSIASHASIFKCFK